MTTEDAALVSVIIPCYNQGHYLGETIESVLAQTFPHFEIIVVDDGSTDNTAEVVARYPGVRYIRQENHGRPAVPRNRGLSESKGDYVIFLDSDDRLLPHALATGLEHLKTHPECAFVSGHGQCISSDGTELPTMPPPCAEKDHYLQLLQVNYIWTPGFVMFRRDILDLFQGFDLAVNKKGSEDYDLYLRIASKFPIRCHDQVIAQYRKHEASISSNHERMLKATLTVLRGQRKAVKGNRQREEAYSKGMRFWQDYYGEGLVEKLRASVRSRREWKQALHEMGVLLRYCPRIFAVHAMRKTYCTLFRVNADNSAARKQNM